MVRRALSIAALMLLGGCAALPAGGGREYLEVETLGALGKEVGESSALALRNGELWTLNDSGNGPLLYKLSIQGEIERRVRLGNAVNIDWESMASDESYLYVADCGNNSGRREWLQLYSVPWERLLGAPHQDSLDVEYIEFSLADPAPVAAPQAHDNDCEAVAAVEGEIWLLTKGWAGLNSRFYRLDPGRVGQAIRTEAVWPVGGLVTGMDYSARRNELVVLGYTLGRLSSEAFIWRVPVRGRTPDWSSAKRYTLWPSGQWEAVVWQGDELLLTREDSLMGEARLGRVRLEQ